MHNVRQQVRNTCFRPLTLACLLPLDQRFPIVLRGSEGIREQFPGDPWIHFCNRSFEVCLYFGQRNIVLLKIMAELL